MFILGITNFNKIIKNKFIKQLIIILSISTLPMLCLITPNYNHWSIILIIYTFYVGVGLYVIFITNYKYNLLSKFIKTIIITIILCSTINFNKYYFTQYLNDNVSINQIPNFIINYDESKKFVNYLDSLNVKHYYVVPLSHNYQQGNTVGFIEIFKNTPPKNIKKVIQKYSCDIPDKLQSSSAAYIIKTDEIDKYPYLKHLPNKKYKLNNIEYSIYINK